MSHVQSAATNHLANGKSWRKGRPGPADTGLTPYHAVRRSLPKLGPATTAVVIGVGGLDHMAVQILKATSSTRVVAVSRTGPDGGYTL